MTARHPPSCTLGNAEVARALRELALRLEMDGVPFKPRAYEKAAQSVEALDRPLHEIAAERGEKGIDALPAIGRGIAQRIAELLRSGKIEELERMRAARPFDVLGLTAIEGLGPRLALALYEQLGVRDLETLEQACRAQRVRELPRFGARSEAKLLAGIEFLARSRGRLALGTLLPIAREIELRLAGLPGVSRASVAGSIRRCKETIGDLDFLVAAADAAPVARAFAAMPEVVHVYARGAARTLVRLASGIDADLRIVPQRSFGAALAYFTGSKAHNVALRRIAQRQGLKLNEYGVFRGRRWLAGRTEQEVYAALGLAFIPPELREDAGELEAARAGALPELIEHGALRGDLQLHSDWTDGAESLEAMLEAARARGLEYVAITDHTRDLPMAAGLDERRLLEQARRIRALDRRRRGIRVLAGAEVNIRKDGSLDVADDVLARLDVVGAAVHSHFGLSRDEQTRRVVRAMQNPHVDLLFHPTARILGRREPIALDLGALIDAARRTGTVLEIDALPERMDLPDESVRRAVEDGVKLAISSDAHQKPQLAWADELGIAIARRGWARRQDVINALPLARCLAQLKDARRKGAARKRRS